MQTLFLIMAFANVAAILFFALRYAIKTNHERKIRQDFSHSDGGGLRLSL